MANSFFDCMLVVGGGKSCRVSDLYTKRDPFISRPQSFHNLSQEEKENARNQANDPSRRQDDNN